ncbi:hypothetical protein AKJ09_06185 [Labilithrix luteola]|uniref:Uncharacterized protein n=1 Tax=Labilithrix luteola TaxID=1391654 RepID=A0A0K1Q1L1_9BACT|nr:hypothetical protein AKJ09_06185 [Labilithrix luteola]
MPSTSWRRLGARENGRPATTPSPGNGCETNIAADPQNCGACKSTYTNACFNGMCQ